ncbi:MAG: hypothetical protein PQJ49_11490 [Sphaerochaetaceae bacterium]|nr:hypothetical protein [Sphaerochaetaceae bacterium]
MVHSSSEQIELKEKDIKKAKDLLAKKYESLGRTVALFVKDKTFSYCLNELSNYEIAKGNYERLLRKANNIKNKVDTVNDCKSEIFELRKLLLEKKREEETQLSRFGAAIYEAYTNNNFDQDIINELDQIFQHINITIEKYKTKSENTSVILFSAIYEKKLKKKKKELSNLFIKASLYILENNLDSKINFINKDKYLISLKKAIKSRENLDSQILNCENRIEEIKKEDNESPNRKLEEIKREVESAKEVKINAAILLGEELYNNLPDDINSEEIGIKAISLIDNITLQLAKIESLEQDIVKLNNEIIITELSAQIAHERTKIKTLEEEILNCNKQINKIENIINQKRDKIIELKKEGTFEQSTLDLIALDESDGNTER